MGLFSGEYSGEIFYDDVKLSKLDMYQMRRTKLSYLEQDPVLFNMSVDVIIDIQQFKKENKTII